MPDITEIESGSGIKPINPRKSNQRQSKYFPDSGTRKNVSRNLHVGEVVLGTIVSNPILKEAYVRLPVGTMLAFLQGNLKKDDTLLFKIAQTEPSLVLKVYGISSKINSLFISSNEITRILDLSATQIYSEIVDIIKYQKSLIIRDDVLLLYKAFSEIDDSIKKIYSTKLVIKTLLFLQESHLREKNLLFKKIIPYFNTISSLKDALILLEKNTGGMPENIAKALLNFYAFLKSDSIPLSDRIGFFLIGENDEKTNKNLYNILVRIISDTSNQNADNLNNAIRNAAMEIVNIIEAQHLINIYAVQSNSPIYFYLPFYTNENYKIIQLVIKNQPSKKSTKGNFEFTIFNENEFIDEIIAKGDLNNDSINLNIMTSSELDRNLIKNNFTDIETIFQDKNLPIYKLGLLKPDIKNPQDYSNNTSHQSDSFSVVV
ncbi:MAG: hypothetical protein ABSG15_12220 [FCB group bacterium]|jgi:hypothetical protein